MPIIMNSNLPPAVQQFFDLPSDSDLDEYLDKDISLDHCTDSSLSGSPHLHDSDLVLLDREYWNPSRLYLVRRRIFGHSEEVPTQSNKEIDWVDDLFSTPKKASGKAPPSTGSITEPESNCPDIPLTITTKAPPSASSVTEPESDCPNTPLATTTITSKAPPSTGSITEPESDDQPVSHVTVVAKPESDGSITEPESDDISRVLPTSKSAARLDHHCIFATPSPPPAGSLYWKYFTKEEDAKMYDRSGTDKSFHAVQQMKKELQALMDA
ncbi:uncharacterized protein EDB93DRAFT_1252913 [Suillus bovinus]|uniref:uncharacterized protein n=1 Tax=Suillus bovinus TaxID=48563 RepID=UPI001B885CDD|nr:uncharacterized protein EDB93DRAFT_1110350 [Suillus bovinus]XP_041305209.1 uncharacterized protein EDB93DRAFT_1252913 [Suillus bovinus]KAG2125078.1 hypothetical protein EDB93DRAFT_1110350 [Suillus bovinus]KAG2140274.1 hypothetical protein EDB93DRAFT_1252913 [Suillus bovinus]